jgi:hypothetical protein
MVSRHAHGVDSIGDIYAGLTVDQSVDKFVRKSQGRDDSHDGLDQR